MKKAVLLVGMSLILSIAVTACGQKEKRSEGGAPVIQETQIPDLSDDRSEPEPEDTSSDESEVSDKEVKHGNKVEPNFISGGETISATKETIMMQDILEGGNLNFSLQVPMYQMYTDYGKVLHLQYGLKIIMASNTNGEEKAEGKTLDDVLAVMGDKLTGFVEYDLKKSYGMPEMEITSQEDVIINDLEFVHFTGNIFSVSRDENGKITRTGLTFYMEGYAYVHTDNTPALIAGVVLADTEGSDPEFYGGNVNYPEKFKEEMTHNLHEMMKTIQFNETY